MEDNTSPSGGSSSGSGSASGDIPFLTFGTPNLNAAYCDAAIKRVTDKYPGSEANKLVSPTADGPTDYSQAAPASGQFPEP